MVCSACASQSTGSWRGSFNACNAAALPHTERSAAVCGIAGMWTTSASSALSSSIEKMTAALVHRGPDDSGTFVYGNAGVALGFRRLAIVDLSEHGHHPMRSSSGRYTIVFNGEVYTYQVLGKQIRQLGHTLRSHSDTEVILTAIEQWGVTAAAKH